ncbi:MAG: hypothetical protein GXO87_00935 [Chlorobi bacterium]|nr:hypothetical protein [Chlorobiota bacterium]
MLAKRPKHRIFDYEPRFFDPEKDETEKRKKRLKFRSHSLAHRKTRSPFFWLIFAAAVVYIYLVFSGSI